MWVDWDDGFAFVAPVGSFAANQFGLHDVIGNVSEWCYEGFYSKGVRRFCIRGGSYNDVAFNARSAFRLRNALGGESYTLGLRPARSVFP